ncbi:MAG: RHS repeat-associated core domain-containing protein [Acidobacteriota bacterium]
MIDRIAVEEQYNVHRWYQPGVGRYTRPDPIGFTSGDLNLYRYAGGNPLLLVDSFGLRTCISFVRDALFSVRGKSLNIIGHVAVSTDGECTGSCGSTGPFLYDPGGSYGFSKGAGSSDLLTSSAPGWSFDDFANYHCGGGSAVETFCFNTTCCEEKEILDAATEQPGFIGGQCVQGVSAAIAGTGPFSDIGRPRTFPGPFYRSIRRLLENNPGATRTVNCRGF